MLSQSFNPENLRKFIARGEAFQASSEQKKSIDEILLNLCETVDSGRYELRPFIVKRWRGKKHYLPKSVCDKWVLRKLNRNISRLYQLRQGDRNVIVKQVKVLLGEKQPMAISKFDIADFYEQTNRQNILNILLADSLLSPQSKQILRALFRKMRVKKGLPRGICLSPTLAEFSLRGFDEKVRQIDGVYFYARYVDDIILFSFHDVAEVVREVKRSLPQGLTLNRDKQIEAIRVVKCRCRPNCTCRLAQCKCIDKCKCQATGIDSQVLEYLGYRFAFSDLARDRSLSVSISTNKVKKIKSRIVHAMLAYSNDQDYFTLRNRLEFLTGNYRISGSYENVQLKSGIYYNYPHIDDLSCLEDLDEFLGKCVYATRGAFGRRLQATLSPTHRRELARHSFKFGYEKRVMHDFDVPTISRIKHCWRYEQD